MCSGWPGCERVGEVDAGRQQDRAGIAKRRRHREGGAEAICAREALDDVAKTRQCRRNARGDRCCAAEQIHGAARRQHPKDLGLCCCRERAAVGEQQGRVLCRRKSDADQGVGIVVGSRDDDRARRVGYRVLESGRRNSSREAVSTEDLNRSTGSRRDGRGNSAAWSHRCDGVRRDDGCQSRPERVDRGDGERVRGAVR